MLSVIVATRNEENNIGRCLESIQRNGYNQSIEIIIVDNASLDSTKKICRQYPVQLLELSDFVDTNKIKNPRGAQLNLGIRHAKGDIIFFPDADMSFEPGLFNEIEDKCKYFEGLYVPEVVIGKSYFGRIRNFERSFYNMTPIDAIRVVKRDLFLKVNGFDDTNISFGPDDWDFTKRVKLQTGNISILELPLYHHEESLNLKLYLQKKAKYTATFDEYISKWGYDKDIGRQLGFSYRFLTVYIENGKWRKVLKQPLLFSSVISLKLLVGVVFLYEKLKCKYCE